MDDEITTINKFLERLRGYGCGYHKQLENQMVNRIKYLKQAEKENLTKHNNDLKKVCPKCGKILTYKMNDSGMYGCLNILCNWQGKPIIKS